MVQLVSELISIPSVTKDREANNKILETVLQRLQGYTVETFERRGIRSVLIYNTSVRPKQFRLLFNAHLDVVPAKLLQFSPVKKDGKLYGRGAIDMKAAAAVMIEIFREYACKVDYPVALQLVTDEEVGGFNGTGLQIEKGVQSEFVVIGEPTNLAINTQAKGVYQAKIVSHGQTGHSAHQWEGDNAILKSAQIIHKLNDAFPQMKTEEWRTSINFATVSSPNSALNAVPYLSQLEIDMRYIPSDMNLLREKVASAVGDLGKIHQINFEPPQYTDIKNKDVTRLDSIISDVTHNKALYVNTHSASDLRFYTGTSSSGVLLGPVGYGLHSDDEYVEIDSLRQYHEILKRFMCTCS